MSDLRHIPAGQKPALPGDLSASVSRARGMTLIELLMVIVIVAGLAGGGVLMIGLLTQGNLKSEARSLATAMQYTYDQAALNNRNYRLVINLDDNSYHTELSDSEVVIDDSSDEAVEAFDDGMLPEELRQQEAERSSGTDSLFRDEEHDPFGMSRRQGYKRAEDAILEAHTLRDGITFQSVRTETRPRPATSGRVAINFFSSGLQQEAIIILQDSAGAKFTLISEPLTGRVRVYSGEREDPDDFGPEEYDG